MPSDRPLPVERAPGLGSRISLVLHKFSRGGSDRVAAYLARGFVDTGMCVELIVFSRGGEVEQILSDMVGADIEIHYLGRPSPWRALDLIRGLPGLVRHLRDAKPDALISTANNMALVTAIALRIARLRRCRLILKTTNPIATSRHRGMVRAFRLWTYRTIFRWTSAVWTLSEDESGEMRQEFPEFATLFVDVANPYVTPEMLANHQTKGPPTSGRTIVTVARLTAQKRLDRLIAAFARLSHPDTRLLILGEGEDRASLSALVAELGLQDRVSMPGYVEDVSRSLHESDLFVLTSDYEGLPAALLEAMAANCRVLSTDCFPAARNLLGHATGSGIIEDSKPAALAKLMDRYLELPRPTDLRGIAESYSIDNGIRSHLNALLPLL
ncbi:glycosyltransferase [Sphingomonas flavescens]|uniref:glycosyltransferase n=1 Tax=Sphingomonas flavescens TaxID=3132797 RepID=UPI002803CBE2|nr:glycosyltransferase [Sphingomonas limnosediminicola]